MDLMLGVTPVFGFFFASLHHMTSCSPFNKGFSTHLQTIYADLSVSFGLRELFFMTLVDDKSDSR